MRRLAFALWLALAGTAAAGDAPRTIEMPGWIRLQVPAGFTAAETERGLTIREDGGLRTPLVIEIIRGPLRTFLFGSKVRETAAGRALWLVRRESARGSGGADWTLWIDLPMARLRASQQREHGRPDFAAVWAIVDSIRSATVE